MTYCETGRERNRNKGRLIILLITSSSTSNKIPNFVFLLWVIGQMEEKEVMKNNQMKSKRNRVHYMAHVSFVFVLILKLITSHNCVSQRNPFIMSFCMLERWFRRYFLIMCNLIHFSMFVIISKQYVQLNIQYLVVVQY